MFVCLTENNSFNEFVSYLSNYQDLLLTFIEKSNSLYSLFCYCDINSLKILIDAYKRKPSYEFASSLNSVPKEVLQSYIDETDVEEDIITILKNSKKLRKDFFLKDSRGYKYIKEGKISPNIIINDNIKVSTDIATSYSIFNALKSPNIVDFRNGFNEFIKVNPSFKLEDMLNKYEDSIINSFDINTGLIEAFNNIRDKDNPYEEIEKLNDKYLYVSLIDKDDINESLRKASEEKVSNLIIDRLFKDNHYNVRININEMLRYQEKVEENILDDETLSLYKKIIEWDNLSMIDKLDIYNKYKNSNLNTKLYEDLNKCRIYSYNRIKDELYIPNLKNDILSKKAGVDVYYLDGENFNMIVRSLNSGYSENYIQKRECFSLISNDNTSTVEGKYLYGYYNIDPKRIISVSENDAYSIDTLDETNNKRINRIMTSEELTSYSGINEIQIKQGDNSLYPDYVVAFNEISLDEIGEAFKLNIPIVLINRKKYDKKQLIQIPFIDESNLYVNSLFDENTYKRTH